MKRVAFTLAVLAISTPAFAQFGSLIDKVQKAKRLADLSITEAEERQIGEQVSARLIADFGVHQDPAVAKYLSLVGGVMAQASTRPGLQWEFIVLDTDGVNAFAAPGGLVHITRGLLGLIKNEAELAGVLGHELVHVTEKHTINSIMKGNAISLGADEVSSSGGLAQSLITRLAERSYRDILNNKFDRDDENESDEKGIQLANQVGYAPSGLSSVLTKIVERNRDRQEANGIFASHPAMKDRLDRIARTIRDRRLTATALVADRYAQNVTFEAKPITELEVVDPAMRGLTGGEGNKDDSAKKEEKKDEKKKGGFGLGSLKLSGGKQAENTQTVASAGGRAGWPDRDAVGGSNKTKVPVTITPPEFAEFKKGIA